MGVWWHGGMRKFLYWGVRNMVWYKFWKLEEYGLYPKQYFVNIFTQLTTHRQLILYTINVV